MTVCAVNKNIVIGVIKYKFVKLQNLPEGHFTKGMMHVN